MTATASTPSPGSRSESALVLEAAPWALAAMIGTMRDAATEPLQQVLAAHPRRTAVLEAAGLVRRDGESFSVDPVLDVADAASARSSVAARLSALRQALNTAESAENAAPAWERHDDDVLLHQGRASGGTGRVLATRIVPELPGLAERLARPGSRVLDVGTGVAALATALATALPAVHVVGIDVLQRALDLAAAEVAGADPAVAERITLRLEDAGSLSEQAAYDLVWLPAPFLSDAALESAIPRIFSALRSGGWVVAGTTPAPEHPLRRAVAAWTADLNGGSFSETAGVEEALRAAGFTDARRFPTVPGGPVLVAAQR